MNVAVSLQSKERSRDRPSGLVVSKPNSDTGEISRETRRGKERKGEYKYQFHVGIHSLGGVPL